MTKAPPTSSTSALDPKLARLIDDITAKLQGGEQVDVSALLQSHPEFAAELREILPTLAALGDLSNSASSGFANSPFGHDASTGVLGDFRLVRELGRGGMGVVYEALQISLNRRVALKVLPFAATMDAKHLQRFRNEAMAAASLRHENIVHVYGVGCERSVHFYAMEMIDGQTLAQIIAGLHQKPQPKDITSDYQPASAAAPTAPAGALSTEFTGIKGRELHRLAARLIADAADALEHAHSLGIVHRDIKPGNLMVDAAGKIYVTDFGSARFGPDVGLTMSGDLLGTLRYMSPEQAMARHGLVDHRTDIYSLGATLYELLCGRPAVVGEDKQEVLKHIAFEEPVPLRKIDKSIPVELETITLKALAKNPAERYGTAKELAEDLRRWREDQPIKAKPPGVRERVVKWGRRHYGLVRTTFAMLCLAVVALVVSNVLISREKSQKENALGSAERRLEHVKRVNGFLLALFSDLDPKSEGKAGKALRVQLGERLVEAAKQLESEFASGFEGDIRILAEMQNKLAMSLLNLGFPQPAITLWTKSLAVWSEWYGTDHFYVLQVKSDLGRAYSADGQFDLALPLLEESLRTAEATLGPNDGRTYAKMNNLANLYRQLGRLDEARSLLERTLAFMKAQKGPDYPDTIVTMVNLASVYGDLGRSQDAVNLLEETVRVLTSQRGPNHLDTLMARVNLGRALRLAVGPDQALPHLESVTNDVKSNLGPDHPLTVIAMVNLAQTLRAIERFGDALAMAQKTFQISRIKFGPTHPQTVQVMIDLGDMYRQDGQFDKAQVLLKEAYRLNKSTLGEDSPDTRACMVNYGVVLNKLGKFDEGLPLLESARRILIAKLGAGHPDTLLTSVLLADAFVEAKKPDQALPLLDTTLSLCREKLGLDHSTSLRCGDVLGLALLRTGKPESAETILRDSLAIRQKKEPDRWNTFNTQSLLGEALLAQKKTQRC